MQAQTICLADVTDLTASLSGSFCLFSLCCPHDLPPLVCAQDVLMRSVPARRSVCQCVCVYLPVFLLLLFSELIRICEGVPSEAVRLSLYESGAIPSSGPLNGLYCHLPHLTDTTASHDSSLHDSTRMAAMQLLCIICTRNSSSKPLSGCV